MQKKVNPIADESNNSFSEKKHEEYVVIPVRDPESLQRQYAVSHNSTGKEITIFVFVIVLIIIGFFAAAKFL